MKNKLKLKGRQVEQQNQTTYIESWTIEQNTIEVKFKSVCEISSENYVRWNVRYIKDDELLNELRVNCPELEKITT